MKGSLVVFKMLRCLRSSNSRKLFLGMRNLCTARCEISYGTSKSVTPLQRSEPPKIVFESAQVKIATQEPVRMASSATPSATKAAYAALKKKQELFQRPGETPVYLKGGPADKVLFGVTLALLAYGIGESLYSVYHLMNPKKG